MISKEQLQAIINIVPDGYTIEIEVKGSQKQSLRSIHLDEFKKKVFLKFTDDINT